MKKRYQTKMLFILLLHGVQSQFLSNFSSYSIDFHTGYKEYLQFQSEHVTIYLCEENGTYLLYLADNKDGYHEIYSAKTQENLKFSYDEQFRINDEPMKLVISQGYVNIKRNFTEFYLAPIKAVSASNLDAQALQVCYNFDTERLWLKIGLGLVCFLVLLSNHGFVRRIIQSLLQSNISWRFSRSGYFLSRSKSNLPQSEKETSL